jgi:C4-dicarboxylate-specific signal transduction histidine kinase
MSPRDRPPEALPLPLLVGGVVHDLGHVLAELSRRAARVGAGLADRDGPSPRAELADELRALEAAIGRADRLNRGLGALVHQPLFVGERVPLGAALERAAAWLQGLAGPGQRVALELPDPSWAVWADAGGVDQVLVNLGQNALQHAGDKVTIRLWAATGSSGRRLRLQVSDDGPGLPAEVAAQPFSPAARPASTPRGRGFGLCGARERAHHMEGSLILVESGPSGVTFALQLERAP